MSHYSVYKKPVSQPELICFVPVVCSTVLDVNKNCPLAIECHI